MKRNRISNYTSDWSLNIEDESHAYFCLVLTKSLKISLSKSLLNPNLSMHSYFHWQNSLLSFLFYTKIITIILFSLKCSPHISITKSSKMQNQLQNLWIFLKYNFQDPSPSLQNPPRLSIMVTSIPITLYLHSLLYRSLYTYLPCAHNNECFPYLEIWEIFLCLFLKMLPYFHTFYFFIFFFISTHFKFHYDFAHGMPST